LQKTHGQLGSPATSFFSSAIAPYLPSFGAGTKEKMLYETL